MEDIIKKWKEAKISYANFEFNCGGDSMNDTDLIFYDDNGNNIEMKSSRLVTSYQILYLTTPTDGTISLNVKIFSNTPTIMWIIRIFIHFFIFF